MPAVRVAEIYRRARAGGYGVAGFCAENLDVALAILRAAEQAAAPVVVVLWQEDIRSVGGGYLESILRHGAAQATVPVAFMLDHGSDLAICLQSMLYGHSGLMYDASHYPLAENVRRTRDICRIAHAAGVLVEGELGTVRRSFETTGEYSEETVLTEPADVGAYVTETGVDALAVSIGTESGSLDRRTPLDFERLSAIAGCTEAYVVLHGGSGVAPEDVRRAVSCGVTAFRFASELRVAYLDALEGARAALGRSYPDTRYVFEPARQAVQERVRARMEQLACVGRAW
jgi:ketose-bisphosphate aldolase